MKTLLLAAIFCVTAQAQSVMLLMGTSGSAGTVATPIDSPGAGTYGSTQTVTLSDSTSGATICYTTNGTTPAATTPGTCSTGSTYSSGFSVSTTTTVKAIGTKSGMTNSSVLTSVYTISGGGGTITLTGHILGPGGGGTSSAIDSTGSSECYVWKSGAGASGGAAPTDSKGNTYTLAFWDSSRTSLWYANASTGAFAVGSGHTFTGPTGEFNSWGGACFSNTLTTANLDSGATAGSTSATTTIVPTAGGGNYNPGAGQHIILVVLSSNTTSGTWTGVSPGFTILDQADFSGGVSYQGGFAYLVQSSGSTITPTGTFSTSADLVGMTCSFGGA